MHEKKKQKPTIIQKYKEDSLHEMSKPVGKSLGPFDIFKSKQNVF